MGTPISSLIGQADPPFPILLFDITSRYTGAVLRVSQVPVTYSGNPYTAIVLAAEGFDIRLEEAELGIAAIPDIAIVLGNVNGAISTWDNANIFKNASITARFVMAEPVAGQTAWQVVSSDSLIPFRGLCNDPDQENETVVRITAFNRFNSRLNLFPPVRIQQLSPTVFPPEGGKDSDSASPTDTDSAIFKIIQSDSDRSRLDWPCGYGPIRGTFGFGGSNPLGNFLVSQISNADIFSSTTIGKTGSGFTVNALTDHIVCITGGTGAGQSRRIASNTSDTITVANAWTTVPDATSDFAVLYGYCGRTKTDCQNRGMYTTDSSARTTRRFRGITFTPTDYRYRPWKGKKRLTETDSNVAKYNQAIPYVYGTVRLNTRILFTQTDRQIRGHLLVCAGEVAGMRDLILEGKQIPKDQPVSSRADVSGNWFARLGARGGNTEHPRFAGHDPYNLMAVVYLDTLPPQFASGSSFEASVLVTGRLIERFDKDGVTTGFAWSDGPGWIYLDVLKESGWPLADLNLKRFHSYSVYADQVIATNIGTGSAPNMKRFTRNLAITDQRPVADVLSGIAGGARILASYDENGKLAIEVENCLADTTLAQAIGSTGVGFGRAADGAGIAEGTSLTIDTGGANEETVTVLSVRLTSNFIEFEANFTKTHSSGETVKASPAFAFVDSSILMDGESRDIARRSQPTRDIPNEFVAEFQNSFRNFAADSVTLLAVREASELGARLTGQAPGEGFPTVDAAVRILRLQLLKGHGRRDAAGVIRSRGNLFVEVASSVKGALVRVGQIVSLTWSLKSWTAKQFRVIAISASQDSQFPYWHIRYILREHDNQWYKDINNSVSAAPFAPVNLDPAGNGGGGGGTGGGTGGGGGGVDPRDDSPVLIFN